MLSKVNAFKIYDRKRFKILINFLTINLLNF